MSFWKKGEPVDPKHPNALPALTVDTEEEAKELMVLAGKKSNTPEDVWPGRGEYMIRGIAGDINKMYEAAERLQELYETRIRRKKD